MAAVVVTVVPREGAKPRQFHVDDSRDEAGKEVRGGASLIETLKRQERRGELFSVTVQPESAQEREAAAKAVAAKRAAKKAPATT